jgi:hypothetical protein
MERKAGPNLRRQMGPLLEEHLLDKNPMLSWKDLGPQIHAISDQTNREIEAILTEH